MTFKEKQKENLNLLSSFLKEKNISILYLAYTGGYISEKCSVKKLFDKQKNNLEKILKKEIKDFNDFINITRTSYDVPVLYSVVNIPTKKRTITSLIYGFSLEDLLYRIKIISEKLQNEKPTK